MLPPLDPRRAVQRARGARLPHWTQDGAAVFVTVRLADSLPKAFVDRWERHRTRLLLRHGIDPMAVDWPVRLKRVTPEGAAAYRRRRSLGMLAALDRGHGACVLGEPWAAEVVEEALLHPNGERLDAASLVVMPNHWHAVVAGRAGHPLLETLRSVKRYAAREINRRLGRTGRLWQPEGFDRLLRDEAAVQRAMVYIRENPRNLPPGAFRLWEA